MAAALPPSSSLLHRLLPFLRWWPLVNRSTLRADAFAGLMGAVVVLPQGVAFATLAGLPAQYGLYCAMVPTLVGALWGSSLHAVTGPTNAMSLVVFATVAPLASPGSEAYIGLVLTLAFLSGLIMVALGLARLGVLVNFISHTVVVGFTAGAGMLIIASQLATFLGVDVARGGSFLQTIASLALHLPDVQPLVVLVGAATLAAGMAARWFWPKAPYMILAMAVGAALAYVLNETLGEAHTGIRTLGALPSALPQLSRPHFSLDSMRSLLGIALALTLLGLTEAVSIARAIALKSGQRIDGNQEFVGQGLANLAASFFSGYPSSASFNRSGLNFEAGAKTPLAAAFAAVLLAVIVFAVAPVVAYLPLASMAAILFLVAWGLFDFSTMRDILRTSRNETAVLAVTFAATLLVDLEIAILAGVTLSLVVYLARTSRPHMRTVLPDPEHPARKFTEYTSGMKECPQAKLLRVEGSIYFGAVDHVAGHLDTLREHSPQQKHLVLMAKSINFVDVSGTELLAREIARRRAAGGRVYFYGMRQSVREALERGGQMAEVGPENVFTSKREMIAGVFAKLDRSVCATCTARIFEECKGLPPPVVVQDPPSGGDSPVPRGERLP